MAYPLINKTRCGGSSSTVVFARFHQFRSIPRFKEVFFQQNILNWACWLSSRKENQARYSAACTSVVSVLVRVMQAEKCWLSLGCGRVLRVPCSMLSHAFRANSSKHQRAETRLKGRKNLEVCTKLQSKEQSRSSSLLWNPVPLKMDTAKDRNIPRSPRIDSYNGNYQHWWEALLISTYPTMGTCSDSISWDDFDVQMGDCGKVRGPTHNPITHNH